MKGVGANILVYHFVVGKKKTACGGPDFSLKKILRRPQSYNSCYVKQLDDGIGRIKFIPFDCEIRTVGKFMVIVLEQLAQHQYIQQKGVFGLVVVVKVCIAIFVAAPVDDGAVNRPHQEVDWQQEIHPPVCARQIEH